jgi:hypothetical protein
VDEPVTVDLSLSGAGEMTRALSVCVAFRVGAGTERHWTVGRVARITGVVVTTDATPQPVRRAIVTLSGDPWRWR